MAPSESEEQGVRVDNGPVHGAEELGASRMKVVELVAARIWLATAFLAKAVP